MADPYVRTVGTIDDADGVPVVVGVDYSAVTVRAGGSLIRLSLADSEGFAKLFVRASWLAGANAERMRQEASDG